MVWISQKVMDALAFEAEAMHPLETGGIIMGYFSQPDSIPVVTWVSGPGPLALHWACSYCPDHKYDEEQIAGHYIASGGHHTYLGDWHSHPADVGRLGRLDRRTLSRIARHRRARVKNPLMLILAKGKVWRLHAWQGKLSPAWPWRRRLEVRELEVRVFGDSRDTNRFSPPTPLPPRLP